MTRRLNRNQRFQKQEVTIQIKVLQKSPR